MKSAGNKLPTPLPGYLDSNGLASYFPGSGGATLTAYILDIATVAGFTLPAKPTAHAARPRRTLKGGLKQRMVTRTASGDPLLHRRLNALQAPTRQGGKPTRAAAALDIDRYACRRLHW